MPEQEKQNGFVNFVKTRKGIIIGVSLGLLVGILMLTIGFFGTLLLAICAGIGAFFGSNNKYKKKLFEILDRILPDIFR